MKKDLENAEAILKANQVTEYEKEFKALENKIEIENQNVIPLKQEEDKKEEFSIKFSDLACLLRENLKNHEKKLYEEIINKIDNLYQSFKKNESKDEEENQEKLNQILLYINDLYFYFSLNDNSIETSEILNKKRMFLSEMIGFEDQKKNPDLSKSLVLINTLLKLHETNNPSTEEEETKKQQEIMELLKKRGLLLFYDEN